MANYGYSQSTGDSTSTSGLPSVADTAYQYMQQLMQWGQSIFASDSLLTDQVIGDLSQVYGQLAGIGSTLMNEYNQNFIPEYNNLVQDANSYASAARIQQAMGAAESGVSQSFDAQRNAALQDLQSFGIDPSSGRYAALDAAERTQQAAAMAGAGFQAEQATEATGRALRSEALQLGSVLPSQATGAYNAAQGAATAMENAKLANAEVGAKLMQAGVPYGQIAMQLRNAKSSQQSTSQQGSGGTQGPQKKEDQGGGGGQQQAPTGGPKGSSFAGGKPAPTNLPGGRPGQGQDQNQQDQGTGTAADQPIQGPLTDLPDVGYDPTASSDSSGSGTSQDYYTGFDPNAASDSSGSSSLPPDATPPSDAYVPPDYTGAGGFDPNAASNSSGSGTSQDYYTGYNPTASSDSSGSSSLPFDAAQPSDAYVPPDYTGGGGYDPSASPDYTGGGGYDPTSPDYTGGGGYDPTASSDSSGSGTSQDYYTGYDPSASSDSSGSSSLPPDATQPSDAYVPPDYTGAGGFDPTASSDSSGGYARGGLVKGPNRFAFGGWVSGSGAPAPVGGNSPSFGGASSSSGGGGGAGSSSNNYNGPYPGSVVNWPNAYSTSTGGDQSPATFQNPSGGAGIWDQNAQTEYGPFAAGAGGNNFFKQGGIVPRSKSPSGGRVTDDVKAKVNQTGEPVRLNANEFIIPRDVVRWKGHKFFQDLIKQSKKQMADHQHTPARAQMKPAIPMR